MSVRFEPEIPNTEKQKYRVYSQCGELVGTLVYLPPVGDFSAGYYFRPDAAFIKYDTGTETFQKITRALKQLNGVGW